MVFFLLIINKPLFFLQQKLSRTLATIRTQWERIPPRGLPLRRITQHRKSILAQLLTRDPAVQGRPTQSRSPLRRWHNLNHRHKLLFPIQAIRCCLTHGRPTLNFHIRLKLSNCNTVIPFSTF